MAICIFAGGCQTPGDITLAGLGLEGKNNTETESKTASIITKPFYTPFFSLNDHLKELILETQRPDLADRLFMENQSYFLSEGDEEILTALVAELSYEPLKQVDTIVDTLRRIPLPPPQRKWTILKEYLETANNILSNIPHNGILSLKRFRPIEIDAHAAFIEEKREELKRNAGSAFAMFNHFGEHSFFTQYPAAPDPMEFFPQYTELLESLIQDADQPEILKFLQNYPPSILGDVGEHVVASAIYRGALSAASRPSRPTIFDKLAASQAVTALNLALPEDLLLRIGIAEATSRALLNDGQIDFPVGIDPNLPATITKISLDVALENLESNEYDAILILDVFLAKSSRRVTKMKNVESTLFLGFSNMSDKNEVDAGTNQLDAVSALDIPISGNSSNGSSMTTLEGNKALGPPRFIAYEYQQARIHARKTMSVEFDLVFPAEGKMLHSVFDVSETERFEVAYGVHVRDPARKNIVSEFDTENDIDDFEDASSDVDLSSIFSHARNLQDKMVSTVSADRLRQDLLANRNRILAKYNATTFDARSLDDPRFGSVAAVYRGNGNMGSGFYVKPDVILTNWHVVEDSKYVEMRLYNGQETYGHVLGVDARLDLALVKVQNRGNPVAFYTEKVLPLGASVDAIGHPHRKLFSITRGIVSAIRKEFSINLPAGAGDKVLYVQTDTPVNPGNSGGPLFLDDKVVAVNTWGLSVRVADGINFSVHYAEVLSFLNEHLPGFHTPLHSN